MSDDEFDEEVEQAAAGDWAGLDLDTPEGWTPTTIEDLRDA